jgi:hypothetical protein
MLFKDSVCIIIDFYLPLAGHSGPLKTQIKTTDASE